MANPAASGIVRSLAASSAATYRFRVRAVDKAGNVTLSVAGPTFHVTRTDQGSAAVHWTGTWTTSHTTAASGGSVRATTHANASATYTFTGRAVGWVAYLASSLGRASVYLDGKLVATVDLHATTSAWRRVAFAKRWSTAGRHVIRVVCRATSGRPRVDIDAFVVLR